jgi:hypothetical protein
MRFLRQSTASQTRTVGPFVDDTDFKTLENALTIANTDVVVSKHGAADTTKNSGGATAHGAGGIYTLTWDATDTDTVGELSYSIKVAGALVVFGNYWVLEEAVYDALFAASALGYVANAPVNVAQFGGSNGTFASGRPEVNTTHAAGTAWGSGAITAASIAADAITAAKIADGAIDANTFATGAITAAAIAADAIGASELAADAVAEIADAIWDEDATGHQTQGTFGQAIGDPVADTNTIFKAVVTDATGATVGVDAAAILADTGTDGVVVSATSVRTAVGLASADLDTQLSTIDTVVDAILVDTGTTLQAELDGIQADTEDIQARIPAALVGGRIDATIDATGMEAGAIDAILDDTIGDSTVTVRQALKLMVAVLGGKLSGAATTTVTIRNVADDTNVVSATVDADGNRSAVTLSL